MSGDLSQITQEVGKSGSNLGPHVSRAEFCSSGSPYMACSLWDQDGNGMWAMQSLLEYGMGPMGTPEKQNSRPKP